MTSEPPGNWKNQGENTIFGSKEIDQNYSLIQGVFFFFYIIFYRVPKSAKLTSHRMKTRLRPLLKSRPDVSGQATPMCSPPKPNLTLPSLNVTVVCLSPYFRLTFGRFQDFWRILLFAIFRFWIKIFVIKIYPEYGLPTLEYSVLYVIEGNVWGPSCLFKLL